MKKKLSVIIALVIFGFSGVIAYADTPTPTPTAAASNDNASTIQQLNQKISELEKKVSDLKSQGDTLSSQISAMDNQIQLTQYKINETQAQIMSLTMDISSASKRMSSLESSLTNVTKVLLSHIIATYQAGTASDIQVLLSSNDISDMMTKENYLKFVQKHDQQLLYDTQQARDDYAKQKTILESQKKQVLALNTQLQQYTKDLGSQKSAKQNLLAETKGSEAHYQRLLEQARAQVNAFKSFATSRVGTGGSILPPQSSPDGYYYNQRDSRWGNNMIGNSSDQMWEVGCLVTSIAMVMKKNGVNVTPSDIAANTSYYVPTTASMLIPWAGGKLSATWGFNESDVDSKLSSGKLVIVGLHTGPYGMHFVVLKSGSGGNYVMDDPWNGPNLNFTDYYSTSMIFQYGWYN